MTPRITKSSLSARGNGATTEHVISQVHELIRSGKLRPGDRLPPEREFSKQLSISRPSLRAGLRSLIAMGVLRARQGSGTFVAEGPPTLDSGQLSLLATLHGFTYDQMYEARKVLEVQVAGLAAEKAIGDDLATLAEELAGMYATLEDPQLYLLHDIRFHRAVGAASGNPILGALMEMVSAVMYQHRRKTIGRAHDFRQSLELHERIYRAIRARKPEAARHAMQQHLALAQQAYATEEESELARSTHSAPGLKAPEAAARRKISR